jgi:hypothetical protein
MYARGEELPCLLDAVRDRQVRQDPERAEGHAPKRLQARLARPELSLLGIVGQDVFRVAIGFSASRFA